MREKKIKITEFKIEESETGKIELVYIPDQTQVLREGQKYVFVFDLKELEEKRKK